jgi:hypothetical protein
LVDCSGAGARSHLTSSAVLADLLIEFGQRCCGGSDSLLLFIIHFRLQG